MKELTLVDQEKYERIDDDLFGVSRRIKRIDDGYFLLRNKKTGKIEVHNEKNVGGTLSLVSPFETLDIRLVHLLYKTRVEHSDDLIREIDETNERIEKKRNAEVLDNAKERLNVAIDKYKGR